MNQPHSQQPDRYVVIGNPVAHSKSPWLHQGFARQTGEHLDYQTLLAPLDGFNTAVQQFIATGGKGANVTVPFKLDAYALCTQLSERARAAGAVNTLSFSGQEIIGDNTDGHGLVTDLQRNAGVELKNQRILVVGAGGAARGALLPLLTCAPAELVIANRSMDKARLLADQFSQYGNLRASEFTRLQGSFDVIINATSASISAQMPPLPVAIFNQSTLAYDMMYADQPTIFMQHAASHGANTRDGWGMLVEQAAEAFYLWRGVRPETSPFLQRNPV